MLLKSRSAQNIIVKTVLERHHVILRQLASLLPYHLDLLVVLLEQVEHLRVESFFAVLGFATTLGEEVEDHLQRGLTDRVLLDSVVSLAFNQTENVADGLVMLRHSELNVKSAIALKDFHTFEDLKEGEDQVVLGEIAAQALDEEFDCQFFGA